MDMSDNMKKGNGAGLIEFLDYAGSRGLMNSNTASSYKASTHKVLSIDEDWETSDVREMDVDDQTDRFARLMGSDYSPDSIKTYQQRFTKAMKMYLDWLENPAEFKSPFKASAASTSGNGSSGKKKAKSGGSSEPKGSTAAAPVDLPDDDEDTVTYPFPLRNGRLAYLQLPRQLPKAEAQRLGAFIDSIAMDPQPALTAGETDES